MRRKKWARPELEKCPYFIDDASELKNNWKNHFKRNLPLHLELGCGKGDFISKVAYNNSEINYIAIDLSQDVLGCARRNIEKEFSQSERKVDNVILVAHNIEKIEKIIGENDIIEHIYINFCNPWPKKKHKKRRLTYPTQLEKYKNFLKLNGKISFKTDDDDLFNESIEYFENCGFKIIYKTYDLHSQNPSNNVLTEHEKMFTAQGIKTKFLIAELIDKGDHNIEATN